MQVGICVVELYIPGVSSLKGKRSVVKSVKERVKNRFNVSVAEVDFHDLHQRSAIGIAMVGNDSRKLNSSLDKIVNYIEGMHVAELIRHEIELI